MRKLKVDYIRQGMMVAKNIYDKEGQILLSSGMPLRPSYIIKLKDAGINEIYVMSETEEDTIFQDVISEQTRVDAKKLVRETMGKVSIGQELQMEKVLVMVEELLEELLNQKDIMLSLSEIRSVDEYTFGHSVNVCVLSVITGIALGYPREKLKILGIGALLHDIGKTLIPLEILNKPGALTSEEYSIIKGHSRLGYEVLRKCPQISEEAAFIALTHHERYDGMGYPKGIKGEGLSEYAKIVAITDVYDAMTSDRVYKAKMKPHQAIEYLISMGNHQFDYEIVKTFTRHVASYPIGTMVMLNNGYKGIVSSIDKNFPHRPQIRYVFDPSGIRCREKSILNLAQNPSITIVDILENLE
ncbi:metal dependent phosphohydrolase [Geosporobacter subterraneus DSM 17957]|uniref:Metal dependent phosphohydrolase n=1 Tax=Geosporobacter subterraneus DSM 17957 TaxID=1121919 RepID=A0A1M6JCW1_9FIRM|nr:HD-GYP domain-containing protein [Geosporobacter subterraneus]SHJ44460.1 metal dependent phosphohydrolase [Geosporobacter subterraneus DSM 17957]